MGSFGRVAVTERETAPARPFAAIQRTMDAAAVCGYGEVLGTPRKRCRTERKNS